jgi:DNA uptake protein ComE-like DNA-binding protein
MVINNSVPDSSETNFALDMEVQKMLDSMREKSKIEDSPKLYPFNPNFISDYKGYTLGMSNEEIDRLLLFRSEDKWVYSAKEFQQVTLISDSLLQELAPLFKFPEWTQRPNVEINESLDNLTLTREELKDLNLATAEDLKFIQGIGDKLSARIVKFRNRLGGFMVNEQLYDVYGLEEEVVIRILKKFSVKQQPFIRKININDATTDELKQLIYFNQNLAFQIVTYRDSVGIIQSFNELKKIEEFPSDKIDRIKLYLSL